MIDPKIEAILNEQINREMSAAYTYYAVVGHFESESLSGFANFFKVQRSEELQHADKFFNYLLDRGGKVDLSAVNKPQAKYDTIIEVFELSLELERRNTKSINEIYKTATDLGDYPTVSFLKWFLDEQVEEEKTMEDALHLVRMAGDDKSAVLVLNEQFKNRSLA